MEDLNYTTTQRKIRFYITDMQTYLNHQNGKIIKSKNEFCIDKLLSNIQIYTYF